MKTALVLSGGGAKGAFQMGALEVLRERGYTWDVAAGVSVGALNATMVAMNRLDRLETIWRTVEREDVYRGRWPWVLFHVLAGRKGLYDNTPLWKMIRREVDADAVDIPLIAGMVDLKSGDYVRVQPSDPFFEQGIFASTIIPMIWPPTEIDDAPMVDGGVRNITPLGDVIDHDPDRIVIVNTEPRDKPVRTQPIDNIKDVALRSLDIVLDETFRADLAEFLRINRLVKQADAQGAVLRREDDRPYVAYDHVVIEPDRPLGSALDFSRPQLDEWIEMGREAARETLPSHPPV